MAWIKIPTENHPLFHAALPRDPRISTIQMFGGVAAMVNGNMLGGLFGRGALVRLADEDQREALALDGAEPFDPMGKGRPMRDTVLLPESIMDEPAELKRWLERALAYTATLPPKKKKGDSSAKAAKLAKAPKATKLAKVTRAAEAPTKGRAPAGRSTPARGARASRARPAAGRGTRR